MSPAMTILGPALLIHPDMWLSSLWKSRDRFSVDELRYLVDQLQKILIVNDVNKAFVIEALRSIAELVTYGDQHDPAFFELFMEKQVMEVFVRILKASKDTRVELQLLQTLSIMIQNLKNEHAIYYIFSNEHINYFITYSFDFRNDELLSIYISFLRAISTKLNMSTISLLVKTQNDEVVSFPLYVEAVKFAFHEENMIRIAVRALTLNVYHVGDENVNKFVTSNSLANYFSNLVDFFKKQCIKFSNMVSEALKHSEPDSASIVVFVEEIEDALYYFSDVISSGVPHLGRLIMDNMLQLLVFPLLLPSLRGNVNEGVQIGATTSMYLICCILRILKTKDLANSIAGSLFCPFDAFILNSESKSNGHVLSSSISEGVEEVDGASACRMAETSNSGVPHSISSECQTPSGYLDSTNPSTPRLSLRDVLLSYVRNGNDSQALGSLNVLSTLLQTKELDESVLDAIGILPRRRRHKKLLLQALVGEGCDEDKLFSSKDGLCDGNASELDRYLSNLKDRYGVDCSCGEPEISPRAHRYQVLDTLVTLFCRTNVSAETMWDGGWLFRQLLPYSEGDFDSRHLKLLRDSFRRCTNCLYDEINGIWCDFIIPVVDVEWKKCRRVLESSSPKKDLKRLLFPETSNSFEGDSSFSAGGRMKEIVKAFIFYHQLHEFSVGRSLSDQPPVITVENVVSSHSKNANLGSSVPRSGTEVNLVDAIPCRIAFERGKERYFCFLAISSGISGWLLLAEELPLREQIGFVRVTAPLAGSSPRIDEKHSNWLHLRIRPSTLPISEPARSDSIGKMKSLVNGRWTLAFRDENSCKSAESMILEEMQLQRDEVRKRLKCLLDPVSPVYSVADGE